MSKDAETGKMQPQVKEGQQPPKAGKGRKWILPGLPGMQPSYGYIPASGTPESW